MIVDRAAWLRIGARKSRLPTVSRRLSAAFTIIELLVGFAVLMILVTLLLSAFSNFTDLTTNSKNRSDLGKFSRTMFDRMTFDVNSAVTSGGVRMDFRKNAVLPGGTASKNDVLVLLAEAKTGDPAGRMAKIGYAVGPYEDQSRGITIQSVLRYTEPFLWSSDTTTIELASSTGAQPVAPGIIRFELAFVNRNGDTVAAPPAPGATEAEVRAFHRNLASIVCTVATLDEDSLQKLTPAQRDEITNRLVDATNGQSPLALWQAVDFSDLPRPVQQGVQFHERYFLLK